MIKSKLHEKRVLITAGAQGIGESITRRVIEAGCHVAIHYFSSDQRANELAEQARQVGSRAAVLRADLTCPDEAENLAAKAVEELGGLDILINNAGSLVERKNMGEIEAAFWRRVIDMNLTSAQFVTQGAIPHLSQNENSCIVNLASLAGRKGGHAGSLVYSTAKGALITWTRSLASELGGRGIRVNALAPGLILGTSFHATHTSDDSAQATIEGIPLGRAGNPDDVARAALYLASEYDGFITGATLDINGGVYAC